MKFKILIENKTDKPGCTAEHGLSIYIEAHGRKLLFDAGATDLFIDNAKKLYVSLEEVEAVVISHGHYDHTGGIPAFCFINDRAKIYLHREAFGEFYGKNDGKMEEEPSGILWDESQRDSIEPRLIYTQGVQHITEDIVVSGSIPDLAGEEPVEKFYIKQKSGEFDEDPLNHEQLLIIREKEGLYIFSGCSHKGVVAALAYARDIFPGEKIAALIAGMHLYCASPEQRKSVIDKLISEDVGLVFPLHCTGIDAICDLKMALQDRCIVAATGEQYGY